MSTLEALALSILKSAIEAVPSLIKYIVVPSDDDSPLAEQVRRILPEEGESAKARKELERRSGG